MPIYTYICVRDYILRVRIRSILMKNFGNFGLYRGIPEGRNMSTIEDEEALYQNLINLS